MIARIAVHPVVFADEPAYAFFARWAFQLGYPTTRMFASSAGIDLRSVLDGTANQRVAALAGLRPDTFDAATVKADGKYACLGDVELGFVGHGWKPDGRRYCLRCVAADRAAGSHASYGHVHVRTWWDLSFFRGCPVHAVPLSLSRGLSTYVVAADRRVGDTEWGDTLEAAADALPETNVEFERYFVGRLGFGARTPMPFLDQFGVGDALWLLRFLDGRPGHDVRRHGKLPPWRHEELTPSIARRSAWKTGTGRFLCG